MADTENAIESFWGKLGAAYPMYVFRDIFRKKVENINAKLDRDPHNTWSAQDIEVSWDGTTPEGTLPIRLRVRFETTVDAEGLGTRTGSREAMEQWVYERLGEAIDSLLERAGVQPRETGVCETPVGEGRVCEGAAVERLGDDALDE